MSECNLCHRLEWQWGPGALQNAPCWSIFDRLVCRSQGSRTRSAVRSTGILDAENGSHHAKGWPGRWLLIAANYCFVTSDLWRSKTAPDSPTGYAAQSVMTDGRAYHGTIDNPEVHRCRWCPTQQCSEMPMALSHFQDTSTGRRKSNAPQSH